MDIKDLPRTTVSHLVRSSDLNHHGTLFAGRMAEWVVEAAFIGAQRALNVDPSNLVCLKIHGLVFTRGAVNGDIIELHSRAAHVGRTSVTMYAEAFTPGGSETPALDGFLTYVHVKGGESAPHGLDLHPPRDGEAREFWERVEQLRSAGTGVQ